MAQELQSLLEKINKQGIQKAEAQANEIIGNAEKEAAKIIANAKSQAESIIKDGKAQAQKSQESANSSIKQAARDVVLELKTELEKRLGAIISANVGEAMTPEFMAAIIKELVAQFVKNPDESVTILAAAKDTAKLDEVLKGSLAKSFRTQPQVFPDKEIAAGLKVSFDKSDMYFDFSDEALSGIIGEYAGPKIAALIKDRKAE